MNHKGHKEGSKLKSLSRRNHLLLAKYYSHLDVNPTLPISFMSFVVHLSST